MPVHRSYQSPRILLAGIHLGWAMHTPPAKILSQSDWSEMTWKLIPIIIEPWDCESHGRAVLLGSLTFLLSTRVPFPKKISCFPSTCVSSDNSFLNVRQEPTFGPWRGSPFLVYFYALSQCTTCPVPLHSHQPGSLSNLIIQEFLIEIHL